MSSYFPTAHVDVQVPSTASNETPGAHAVQPVAVPSVHSAQDMSHAVQLPLVAKVAAGHSARQRPSLTNGVLALGHVRQAVLEAPAHVSQEG